MDGYKFNRVNELLGESVIYESVKKKTKIKLSLDDGSKKEMDFDGSLDDAKKKFSGKKVKTIRKSKSGDIIGEAVIVSVEELNETKSIELKDGDIIFYKNGQDWLKGKLISGEQISTTGTKFWWVNSFANGLTRKDIKTQEEMQEFRAKRKENGELSESKELIPFGYFKITYSDGSSKKTEARAKTAEDFKKYLTQDGNDVVTDEDEDGKETKKKIVKVEKLDEAELDESMDTEVHTFETPMDMFRQIVKESTAIYIKEKNGKIEGRYNPKPKKDWILVDGFTASRAVQLYKAATEEQKAKIDKLSLTRFLNAIWKTKKVNESEETKESFKVDKDLIISRSLPQYFETMLWSSTDMDSGEPLDKEYDIKDISKALKDSSKKDLLSFAEYCEKNCSKELEEYLEEEGYESFGHDFSLSRNGHGAGFFDRGNGYKALQKASKTFGSVDPMVNKGKIVA